VTARNVHARAPHAPERGIIRRVLGTLLLVVAFGALAFAGYEVKTGQWHATPVLSGSMRPGLQPGDVAVTQRVPVSDLHVRDVIVFYPPNETQRQTIHRIVKLTVKGGTTSITTWGDANRMADPAVASLKGATAYRMVRVVPLAGYPAIWLQNGGRGLLAIGLGAILLVAALVTVLRPDKPATPPRSPGTPGGHDDSPGEDKADPAGNHGGPRRATAA
jgi:signal peptidase I